MTAIQRIYPADSRFTATGLIKKRSIKISDNAAHNLDLGTPYAEIIGYDITASADTTVSMAVVDEDGQTIATLAESDYTTLTHLNLTPENAVTEDGTAATGNAGKGGILARRRLVITLSALTTGTVTVAFYCKSVRMKKISLTVSDATATKVPLGFTYGEVVGYDLKSSSDTTVSVACVDADAKTILTVGSSNYTTLTRKNLVVENAVTEDGTAATGNAQALGVVAHSPLTITVSGIAAGVFTIGVFVKG